MGLAASYVGLLGAVTGAAVVGGLWEARAHRRVLQDIPLRIHVNGTRGKTSVTRAIAALFRNLGRRTMAKCTGTRPLWIGPDGTEHPWPRRGRVRVHEQTRFLRMAARHGVDVAVVECMAVDPMLQWVCEHELVRSHIGVITNVRRDHFEEMGSDVHDIARSLANTIPRHGVLVTADAGFAPFFKTLAAPLGTRVVLVTPENETDDRNGTLGGDGTHSDPGANLFAENFAVVREVARIAGFSDEEISRAMPSLPYHHPPRTRLPAPAEGSAWIHAWSMNDTDSMASFLNSDYIPFSRIVPLFNHRADRPLRALDFGRLFASGDGVFRDGAAGEDHSQGGALRGRTSPTGMPRVLVTGDPGVERLFRTAGVPSRHIQRVVFPPTEAAVALAVADLRGPVAVVGCGNARGLAALEAAPDTFGDGTGDER